MNVSDVIRIGDKIDIRLLQQMNNMKKDEELPELYRSQVLDIKENGNFEISMPSEKGKLILLPLGVRFEFCFYSFNGGLYKSIGQIVERYKRDGFYMLEIQLRTTLEKLQRREFYRYNCAMDVMFYELDEEQKKMHSAEDILQNIMDSEPKILPSYGVMVDLSGGGMKFRAKQELKTGDKILVMLNLKNDRTDLKYHVTGSVIACVKAHTSANELYESRVKFHIEDNRIREEIIRYIFEEERKIRQKENG